MKKKILTILALCLVFTACKADKDQNKETDNKPAQTPTTPQNPNGGVPETVTISQGQNEQGVKSEDAPTLMTKAASQVKTGIKGVGYLGIVLVGAIIAFVVLSKKKEEK